MKVKPIDRTPESRHVRLSQELVNEKAEDAVFQGFEEIMTSGDKVTGKVT
jgi:hypothetical protein